MFCHKCGQQAVEGATFCQRCGVSLLPTGQLAEAVSPLPPPPKDFAVNLKPLPAAGSRAPSDIGGDALTAVSLRTNFGHYMAWWLFWVGLGGLLTPVVAPNADGAMPPGYFWEVKIQQLMWGLMAGAVCGILFTAFQNTVNKQRRKVVSWAIAMAVLIAVKLTVFAISPWIQSREVEQVAKVEAANMKQKIDSAQAQVTPEKSATALLIERSKKESAESLAASRTEGDKSVAAAGQFFGAYWLNTRIRVDYCAALGTNIKSFVSAYEQKHMPLFLAAERIQAQEFKERGISNGFDMLYKVSSPGLKQFVAQDMKDTASTLKVTESELCQAMEQNSVEWADALDLRKSAPQMAQVLLKQ